MKKLIFKILIFILIAALLVTGIITLIGYNQYKIAIDKTSIDDSITEFKDDENYVKLEDISDDFKTAIVSVEDHRFYAHHGIDIITTFRAAFTNFKSKSLDYGGSTITQQLARIIYFTQEKQFTRKIAELFVAFDIEKQYSKDDILELYINVIYFGNGYYGIKEASDGYFNKLPSELTFEEATYLAGLPNAPSVYSANSELGEQRRLQVVNAIEKYKDNIKKEESN